MTPEEFRKIWTKNGDNVSPLPPDRLKEMNLSENTFDFLVNSGLPEEAAPFLNFVTNTDDKYNNIQFLTSQYDIPEPEYNNFIVIGSDGGGNPIAVNTENEDRIEWLDHEDEFSSRFMNSSINKLAEFLVIYRDFVQTVLAENGNDLDFDESFSDEQFNVMKERMVRCDNKALSEDGFWKDEIDMLLENRKPGGS